MDETIYRIIRHKSNEFEVESLGKVLSARCLLYTSTLGAKQIKSIYPESVTIFIIPPSFEILEKRLRARGTDSEDSIRRRLSCARSELEKYKQFDYIVFNDDLESSIQKVLCLLYTSRGFGS